MLKTRLIIAASLFCASAHAPLMAKTISISATAEAQEKLQEALIEAEPGDVVELGAGTYVLTDGLSLDVDNVTVRGAGNDKTVLSFKGQRGAGEGLLVTSDGVTLRDFAVEDTKGDGIKSKGADNIVYRNMRVEWTGGPKATNGAYGIYPVSSKNVLIDGAIVKGASDAGIYVGQSQYIIVRNSQAMHNVAGIEIENCYDADVYHNISKHNTGGILVFDLPNLPQQAGRNVRVFENIVSDNDEPNFAPKGNIVAGVPTGTGVMVMANNNVEVFRNIIKNNGTANVLITAYPNKFDDKNYVPTGQNVWVAENLHGKAGFAPDFEGGKTLAAAFGGSIPEVLWDGLTTAQGSIVVNDAVGVMSLGYTKQGQGVADAKPSLVKIASTKAKKRLPKVVLPKEMEVRAK